MSRDMTIAIPSIFDPDFDHESNVPELLLGKRVYCFRKEVRVEVLNKCYLGGYMTRLALFAIA